jgi:fatty acid desaturase
MSSSSARPTPASETSADRASTSAASFDPRSVDLDSFIAALDELRREAVDDLCEADFRHLRRTERWGRACTVAGYATAWVFPNPLSAALIALGMSTRFVVMHFVGHRAYDRVPGVPPRYDSTRFAHGWRRFVDWLDWVDPEAWKIEHNHTHHQTVGQDDDPDLVEEHMRLLRQSNLWRPLRYLALAFMSTSWRLLFNAPMTMRLLQARREGRSPEEEERYQPRASHFLDLRQAEVRELWRRSLLPNGLLRYLVVPLLFLPLGRWAAVSVLINSVLAEILSNVHIFIALTPNHCADDLYRFDGAPLERREALLRQVVGTANYRCGGELNDFLHLWLNYHIEHHLWPNLPMTAYRRVQPRVRRICEDFGVPYVQQGVWQRLRKSLDVCVGRTSMPRMTTTS